MPIILALRRKKHKDQKFKTILGHIVKANLCYMRKSLSQKTKPEVLIPYNTVKKKVEILFFKRNTEKQ